MKTQLYQSAEFVLAVILSLMCGRRTTADDAAPTPVGFRVELQTVMEHDDGHFLWFHPRAAAMPKLGADGGPAVVMTLQKHLESVSDYYSGLSVMRTNDRGATWSAPEAPPELAWRRDANGVVIAVADVTPGWHAPSGKLLAIGAEVRYNEKGEQLDDEQRAHQTAYTVFDPKTNAWATWRRVEMPPGAQFDFARCACAQWSVEPDGTILAPFYIGPSSKEPHSATVVRCNFDGNALTYVEHGDEIALDVVRGLVEPSLACFQGRYYLTLRNDVKAYVTRGDDGLHYEPIRPWTFDDGEELGSYNTQQHWLANDDGLFLAYTRRGANNDHVTRHRAPLFLAQVDPSALQVMRATEQVLVPERGATLGNFGASAIDDNESWVTVSEGIWNDDARKRGATGATYVARVIWMEH